MKNRTLCLVSSLILATLSSSAFAADNPQRKAGLWETTMRSPQMQGHDVVSQQCIDNKTDAEMMKRSLNQQNQQCTTPKPKRTATGWEMDSVCTQDGSTTTMHMTMSGDMNSQYTMHMKGKRTPAQDGISEFESTMNARYLGACPAGMKPGDMKINGMQFNADGMPAGMSAKQMEDMKKMMEQMKKQGAK